MYSVVDPLADMYPGWSPYNYVMNNPISNTDPTGMSVEEIDGGTRYTGQDAQDMFKSLQQREAPAGPTNEYVRDKKTGELVKVGDKGGDRTDYIYDGTISEDGETIIWSEENPSVRDNYFPSQTLQTLDGRDDPIFLAFLAFATGGLSSAEGLASTSLGLAAKRGSFRGGKQSQRDQTIMGYPQDFRRWYHKQYKEKGAPDATKSELKEIHADWIQQGKPRAD